MGSFATWIEIGLKDNFSSQLTKCGMLLNSVKGNLNEFATKGKVFDDVAMKLTIMSQSVQMVADSFAKIVDEPKKLAMDMEDSLATVNSVLTDEMSKNIQGFSITTSDALKLVNNEAIKFSKTHSDSAKSFVDVNYLMIGAGLNTRQSIFATSQSMLLAKATMGTATEAANLLADVYNNMGDKLKNPQDEFTRLSDILAKTQGVFKIANLNQLNEGLKYGIPTANAFGISIEQLSAVIGQLNNSGLSGTMAGTGFSAMLSQMSKASAEVGFDIIVNEKGDMNIIETIGSMKSKYEELSKTLGNQKTADLFNKSFGQEAFKSVSNLMTQFDSLQTNFKAVQNASINSGATMDAYNKITDTTSNKLQVLQNKKDALKIKMGELMKESNKMGLGFSTAILTMNEAFVNSPIGEKLTIIGMNAANMGKGFFNATAQGMQFAASGLTIISLMGKMGSVKNLLINGFSLITTGFATMGGAIIGFLPVMGAWITSAWMAVVAHMALAWPIYAVIGGIALLAVAAFLIIKNWGVVSKFLISTWETVKTFFVGLWNNIVGIFQKAWDFIWNGLLNNKFIQIALAIFTPFIGLPIMIIKHWGAISGFFIGLWDGIVTGVKNIWSSITTFFSNLWNGLLNNKFVQIALSVFLPFIGLPIMIIKHWGAITGFFVGLWNGIVTGVKNIWSSITTFFSNLWNGITNIFKNAWDKIWNGLLNNKFVQIALSIFAPFIGIPVVIIKNWDKITAFFKGLPTFFKGIWKEIVTNVKSVFNGIEDFFTGIWDGVISIFKDAINLIKKPFEFVDNLMDKFFGKEKGKKGSQTIGLGIEKDNSIKTGLQKNLTGADKLLPKSDAKEGPFSKLTSSGSKIISTLATGVSKENSLNLAIKDKFGSVLKDNKFENAIENKFNTVDNAAKNSKIENIKNITNEKNNKPQVVNNYFNINAKALANEIKELENAKAFLNIISNLAGVSI